MHYLKTISVVRFFLGNQVPTYFHSVCCGTQYGPMASTRVKKTPFLLAGGYTSSEQGIHSVALKNGKEVLQACPVVFLDSELVRKERVQCSYALTCTDLPQPGAGERKLQFRYLGSCCVHKDLIAFLIKNFSICCLYLEQLPKPLFCLIIFSK